MWQVDSRTASIGTHSWCSLCAVCCRSPTSGDVARARRCALRPRARRRQRRLLPNTALLAWDCSPRDGNRAPLGIVLRESRLPARRRALSHGAGSAPTLHRRAWPGHIWVRIGCPMDVQPAGGHRRSGLVLYPLSMLATEVAMRRIDGRLEEAALIVAPRGHVLRRITLPLVAPVLAAAL